LVQKFLNVVFPEQWIKISEPTTWPACSSVLNPLDFHLGGHLNSILHGTEVSNNQYLQQQIQNGLQVIGMRLGIFQGVRQSLFRPAMSCLEDPCGHLQHFVFIQKVINQKSCFGRPMYSQYFFILLWCRFTFCRFCYAFFVYPVFSEYGMHKKQIKIDWCSTPERHTRSNANDARLNSLTPPCPINDF
jgi:hypothetical protein